MWRAHDILHYMLTAKICTFNQSSVCVCVCAMEGGFIEEFVREQ